MPLAQNREARPKKKPRGRPFEKGNRVNPGGRPKGYGEYIRSKCGHNGELLTNTLIALITNDTDFLSQHALEVPNTKEVLIAIDMLWDRGYGKAPLTVDMGGEIRTRSDVHHHYDTKPTDKSHA